MSAQGEITRILERLDGVRGDARAAVLEELVPKVYGELKILARSNRYRWAVNRAPGTTSLVHEAYLKIAKGESSGFDSRHEFYALASRAMRSILVDNARRQSRQKRGGGRAEAPLEAAMPVSAERPEELLALDEALERLEGHRPRLARIVECRCFGGLTVEQTASTLGVSTATVKRDWRLARAWLYRELQAAPAE